MDPWGLVNVIKDQGNKKQENKNNKGKTKPPNEQKTFCQTQHELLMNYQWRPNNGAKVQTTRLSHTFTPSE